MAISKKTTKTEKTAPAKEKAIKAGPISDMASKVLLAPWITEASTAAMEQNKYVFKVDPKANKNQIRMAIEELYKVKVASVNTISVMGKLRGYGRTPGRKAGLKKAIITLKAGDKIELFEGV